MTAVAAAVLIVAGAKLSPAPHYVSCPGGYITSSYADCPTVPQHRAPETRGGGGGGGLLGGLLGGLGL